MINLVCIALAAVAASLAAVVWNAFDDLDEAEARVEELEERCDYLTKELRK